MALSFFKWSKTAANNATADPNVLWSEGQAPSTVNDSARAMMASTAGYRDDISGSVVTGGTSTAYTLTSNQIFDSLANMSYQMIAFTPNATNTGACTLNVDGLGAKPIVTAPDVPLVAGMLIAGTPYVALYRNDFTTPSFVLQNILGNPYNVPIGGGMDYWGTSVPNSNFAFPAGQAISRTTYATLFSMMGTTYGVGDGSTTFNLPDKTGRVSAMREASATRLTSTYFVGNSTAMGAVGGGESSTLTLSQLPTGITSTGSFTSSGGTFVSSDQNTTTFSTGSGGVSLWNAWATSSTQSRSAVTGSLSVTSSNTGGNPHRTIQPTIICNYIIRVA